MIPTILVRTFATLCILVGSAASMLAQNEINVPQNITLSVGERVRVAVIGTLDEGGSLEVTFRYDPAVIRILGANGGEGFALRCNPLEVVENRVESASSAVFTVLCPFSVTIGNDTLVTLDLEGIGGEDTVGFLRTDKVIANGLELNDVVYNTGTVVRIGGVTTRQVVKEGITGNYPNPFASRTRIVYVMDAAGPVKFIVRNAQGRLVQELTPIEAQAGENSFDYEQVAWQVAGGVYILQMTTEAGTYYHTMTVMK
ncbi:MAG TPA: T9SS type A sorting domain-containing protein [Candidatus Didemnitutus sp.]|nr:T9SS type A sorting domain-containing protein [Candidatus Didemnitutus sp.]